MRAVIVSGQDVVNIIEYDPNRKYNPGSGLQIVVPDNPRVGIGWTFVNGSFVAPTEPDPAV